MKSSILRTVFLAHAIEEADPEGRVVPLKDRELSLNDSDQLTEPNGLLIARSQRILEAGTKAAETISDLSRSRFNLVYIGFALVILALALGAFANRLGNENQINLLSMPLIGTLVWNISIYVVGIVRFFGKWQSGPLDALLRDGLRTVQRKSFAARSEESDISKIFRGNWEPAIAPIDLARRRSVFHLAAFTFAAALIAGMYLDGLRFEYRAVWQSTFLSSSEVQVILNTVFWPASVMMGVEVPDVSNMRWSGGEGSGQLATPWIHLYGATIGIFILIPRLALFIIWQLIGFARLSGTDLEEHLPGYADSVLNEPEQPADNRIFPIESHPDTIKGITELSREETRLLVSIEHCLAQIDYTWGEIGEERNKKRIWIEAWGAELERKHLTIERDYKTLLSGILELENTPPSKYKRFVIMFEASVFRPYFNLEIESLKRTKFDLNLSRIEKRLREISGHMGVPYSLIQSANKNYEDALKGISPRRIWKVTIMTVIGSAIMAITAGAAAPAIGLVLGGLMGLSGAAATSAGLALLGGGAIATGGLGVAGGTATIIGGGAIIGAGMGGGLMALVGKERKLAISQLAKLEAITKVVASERPDGEDFVESVILQERNQLDCLKRELTRGKRKSEENKNVETSIKCFQRAIDRLVVFKEGVHALGYTPPDNRSAVEVDDHS